MFRSGRFVAEHVEPVEACQVQPNGVDIGLDRVERPTGGGSIGIDGKSIGGRRTHEPEDGRYTLEPGSYIVGYAERIAVPEGHVGFILPRSSLLRNGATLHTAVWDTGYEGRGEGLLTVGARLGIDDGARIGQFVLAGADHRGRYDGTYQGEGLDGADR
ncbi:MAG: deoxyuridine 5'-triphosphate nucleotidohydrolase [Halobacteriales archaeon]